MPRFDWPDSPSISPWPISPPAPVISTTGLRTTENYTERIMRTSLAIVLCGVSLLAQPRPAARVLFDKTMRVDYFHTGGPKAGEIVSLDRVVNDGPWPGSRTQLTDTTNLGK